jgi:hypothetical protein
MGNHDFVSDGFLAPIATCLVLLCSSLLVIALATFRRKISDFGIVADEVRSCRRLPAGCLRA